MTVISAVDLISVKKFLLRVDGLGPVLLKGWNWSSWVQPCLEVGTGPVGSSPAMVLGSILVNKFLHVFNKAEHIIRIYENSKGRVKKKYQKVVPGPLRGGGLTKRPPGPLFIVFFYF